MLFSIILYQVALSEIGARLENLQLSILSQSNITVGPNYEISALRSLQNLQSHEAATSLFVGLFYANILILISGGIGSYVLARRTLRPIEQAHEAQKRFTSDASHELRTPLAVMKTELEVALRDTKATKQDLQEVIQSNLEEVNTLTKLSQTLLDLARQDYDGLEKEGVSLNALVKQSIKNQSKRKRSINLHEKKKDIIVYGHPGSLEELIVILLDNAIKHSPKNTQISITVSRRKQRAHIEITNEGPGIKSNELPFIFDRFYQADVARTTGSNHGYGLGLSLAQKIIDIHNGEISAKSVPNKKTTFTVLLPIFDAKK